MGHKKACASTLGVITLVLAGFWALPRVLPGLGCGLDELNQIAGTVFGNITHPLTGRTGSSPEASGHKQEQYLDGRHHGRRP